MLAFVLVDHERRLGFYESKMFEPYIVVLGLVGILAPLLCLVLLTSQNRGR